VIGPGFLPRLRPLRRPLAYTRLRKRSYARTIKQARAAGPVNTEIVAFDRGPSEFPVATMRPHDAGARVTALFGALDKWLDARWQWFRPRTVPCAVAGLGMLAVLWFSEYLTQEHADTARATPSVVHVDLASR
jgi:hypothetical protein